MGVGRAAYTRTRTLDRMARGRIRRGRVLDPQAYVLTEYDALHLRAPRAFSELWAVQVQSRVVICNVEYSTVKLLDCCKMKYSTVKLLD